MFHLALAPHNRHFAMLDLYLPMARAVLVCLLPPETPALHKQTLSRGLIRQESVFFLGKVCGKG